MILVTPLKRRQSSLKQTPHVHWHRMAWRGLMSCICYICDGMVAPAPQVDGLRPTPLPLDDQQATRSDTKAILPCPWHLVGVTLHTDQADTQRAGGAANPPLLHTQKIIVSSSMKKKEGTGRCDFLKLWCEREDCSLPQSWGTRGKILLWPNQEFFCLLNGHG